MKINLVSDLHIDVNRGVFPQLPGGEVLLVAGDLAEICSLNPLVMCNPFGYIVSRESTGFNELFNFEVK